MVPKGIRRFKRFDDQVISLYALGMTVGEIQEHIQKIYQTDVSKDLISTVTDGVIEEVNGWQNRPLEIRISSIIFRLYTCKKQRQSHSYKQSSILSNMSEYGG